MQERFDTDVLICGSGVSGLTTAIELARPGSAFMLIDKIDQPFGGSRGKGIQPRTQEILEDLDVIDRVVAAGGPYLPVRHYFDGGFQDTPIADPTNAAPSEPYQQLWMLPQSKTEAILRDRLAELGYLPRYGCELVSFEQDEDGVTARLAMNGEVRPVRARYLVATDGGRSPIRMALNVAFPGETLPIRSLVADVDLEGLDDAHWHRWGTGPDDQIMVTSLRGTTLFQIYGALPLEGEVDLSAAGLSLLLRERTGRDGVVVNAVHWASAFGTNIRVADQYRIGRIFLVGDAAHVHPPTGGQGLNTSIQDAYNLGWKLAAVLAGASEALLATYEAERRPIAAEMVGVALRLLTVMRDGQEFRRGRELHQLDLNYRSSTLSVELREREAGPRAGDRAPDAPCRGAAGRETHLFNLFRGPHWTMLAFGIDREKLPQPRNGLRVHVIGDGGDIVDDRGHIYDAYQARAGEWILVRPDGYIGMTGGVADIAELETRLSSWLPAGIRTAG